MKIFEDISMLRYIIINKYHNYKIKIKIKSIINKKINTWIKLNLQKIMKISKITQSIG